MNLFSYVVDHDYGYAPNPENNVCTLVHCKFGGKGNKRNIVEIANVGDWVIGTGGKSTKSVGKGKIVYVMCITGKISFENYLQNYIGRVDCVDEGNGNEYALISNEFYYFGKDAVDIFSLPSEIQNNKLECGRGFKYKAFDEDYINTLVAYFRNNYHSGAHGLPVDPLANKEKIVLLQKRDGKCLR